MPNITISYRRADSDAIAGRIRDRLAREYGDDAIFMDIDNIPLGVDFREQIRETLSQVEILLVIIGPQWRGPRSTGKFRIFDETDPCRVEVEQGLARGIATIPVLVNGAEMPGADELPETLRELSYHNAAVVDAGRDFHQHMDRLIRSIDQILGPKHAPHAPRSRLRWLIIAGAGIGIVGVALIAAFAAGLLHLPVGATGQPAPPLSNPAAGTTAQSSTTATTTPSPSTTAAAPTQAEPAPQPRYASPNEAAEACEKGSAPIFYEDFESPDTGWSGLGKHATGSTAYFQNGQLIIKAAADDERVVGHIAPAFRDASLCVRVISPPASRDSTDTSAGMVFWASDTASSHPDHAFAAEIFPAGGYLVAHRSGTSSYDLAADKQPAGVKIGPSAVNLIKVVTGASGTAIYINGVKGQVFNAAPDDNTRFIGFVGESEKDQVNEWRFLDIVMAAPNYSDELTDFGVAPQNTLHFPVGGETPMTIPGAMVLRTGELSEAIQKSMLDGTKFLMFDVLGDDHTQTITGAQRLDYAGGGDSFNDDVQRKLSRDLKAAAKNNLATPVVFFCEGAECWESYNAALRAQKIGFNKVYWYRGGIYSWKAAGLSVK